MSKARAFSQIIKVLVRIFVVVIRTLAVLGPRLIRNVFRSVGKRLRFSITFKMATNYSLIFAAIFFAISIAIVSSFVGLLLFEARNDLTKNADYAIELLGSKTTIPEEQLNNYARVEGVTFSLLNEQRVIRYSTATADGAGLPDKAVNHSGLSLAGQQIYVNVQSPNRPDVKYVVVERSLQKEIFYVVILTVSLIITFLIAVLLIVFRGSITLRRMLKPIDDMIKTARRISVGDLHTRLNVGDSHDELKDLAETFNEMLDRIQSSYEKQNRFVSDASHELRTPIAVIQGYANLLRRWGKEDKDVLAESLNAISNEADSMKELVERLLFLARADKDTQKVEKTLFSLDELIDEVVKETKLFDSEHEISAEAPAAVTLDADRGLIKQALRIFVDNSIRYTPKGGTIKISSHPEGRQVKVQVEDNGIGISAEDLPYVFDRFYKCDKSRTRESGGTGLGLSIAKWIIEKHGGNVSIESVLEKGTRIIVRLPLS